MLRKCISIAEFCDRYGVGKTLAYQLLRKGDIKALKIGSRTLITCESAEDFFFRSIVQRWGA